MNDNEILQIYKNLLPFLGNICGSGCELCLHDIRNPENSIIAIANNQTERKIGDPMTDLAISTMEKGLYTSADSVLNYNGSAKGQPFLSSTFFIKNEGRLIGLLCANKNLDATLQLQASLTNLLASFNLDSPINSDYSETLESPITDILPNIVSDAILQTGLSPERMTIAERRQLVINLNDQGVLSMKGAVKEIASQLGISEPTVYRYMNGK